MSKSKYQEEKLLIDLEEYAREIDPDFELVGNEDIERLSSVLAQSTQNNIIYAGPSGVGKTATLLGMAIRKKKAMDNPDEVTKTGIPLHMIDRRYKILDVNALFDYGDPETIDRDIKRIFKELEMPGQHVLVVEDANDLLKGIEDHQAYGLISSFMREIRRGGFQTIWMVREEPAKGKLEDVLNSHSDVRELFTVLHKKEPGKDHVVDILKSRKSRIEKHFDGLEISDEALSEVAALTQQYPSLSLWTRAEPARSITFLDAAASTFVSRGQTRPPELRALEKQLEAVTTELQFEENKDNKELMAQQRELQGQVDELQESWSNQAQALFQTQSLMRQYQDRLETAQHKYSEKSDELKERLTEEKKRDENREPTELELNNAKTGEMRELEKEMRLIEKDLEKIVAHANDLKSDANHHLVLAKTDIQEYFSAASGIPTQDLDKDETEKLLNLEDTIKQKLYGQDESVDFVANTIRAAKAGFKGKKRPMGVFVLLGSSGTGKSFLAECAAEALFGSSDEMTPFDMSEFMEKHTVSQLKGAPPGYAGYGQGGRLTNAVRNKPYQAILMDEIEKAHPDVFKILLQVFNDGRLSDELGTARFNNTVFFLTTNIAQELAMSGEINPETEEGQARIKEELRNFFPQELINRIDGFLLFNPLEPGHIKKIVTRDIAAMNKIDGLVDNDMSVHVSEADIEEIVADKYVVKEGARQVQKFVENKLGGHMARFLLQNKDQGGGTIDATYDPESNGFQFNFIAKGDPLPEAGPADPKKPANDVKPVDAFQSAAPGPGLN